MWYIRREESPATSRPSTERRNPKPRRVSPPAAGLGASDTGTHVADPLVRVEKGDLLADAPTAVLLVAARPGPLLVAPAVSPGVEHLPLQERRRHRKRSPAVVLARPRLAAGRSVVRRAVVVVASAAVLRGRVVEEEVVPVDERRARPGAVTAGPREGRRLAGRDGEGVAVLLPAGWKLFHLSLSWMYSVSWGMRGISKAV